MYGRPVDSGLPTDLLTIAQVCRAYGVSRTTLWRWIRDSRLPADRLGPRTLRVRRADVERLLVPVGETPAVSREQLTALREIERVQREIARRRGGRPVSDATEAMARLRDERSTQ